MRTTPQIRWNGILVAFFLATIASKIKGDDAVDEGGSKKPLRLERLPLIDRLSASDINSLREGLKVSADPKCIEALQETIIKFLKGIRQSDGIRIPRQDDGDGDDGDDGDGGGGIGAGLLGAGGAGGFLGNVNLPPVVPQVLGALTEAFTGLNSVVNATSGQTSLPNFLFSSFSNLVGQFTGNTPPPVTPPTYFPIPPGGFPNRWPSGQAPLRPQLPIAPLPPQLQQQPGGFPLVPVSARPPIPVRRSPRPKPKPTRSEPPKSSLWNIYKSFGPSQGANSQGGLTDFQIAHPEGFHSELLQSISSSLSKVKGPSNSPDRNSNAGSSSSSSSSSSGSQSSPFGSSSFNSGQTNKNPQQVNNNEEPSVWEHLQQSNSIAGDISAPPQTPANPPAPTASPPKLVYNPEPSNKPSFLITQIIPGRITLPPELLPQPTTAAPPQSVPDEANDIKGPDGPNEPPPPLLNRPETKPEDEVYTSTVADEHETGTLLPITDPILLNPKTPASRLPPPASRAPVRSTPKPVVQQTEDYYDSEPDDWYRPSTAIYNLQPVTVTQAQFVDPFEPPKRRTSAPRTLPPTRDWSIPREKKTTTEAPVEQEAQQGGGLVTELSISSPNRLTNWITGNTNNPESPAKGRPVIINNMFYPNLETALNAQKPGEPETSPPRRRRKTTTTPPPQDSDYYEDGDGVPRKGVKKLENGSNNSNEIQEVASDEIVP